MTRFGCMGWDMGALNAEPRVRAHAISSGAGPVSVGSVALETSIVRTGAGSLKVTPASGAAAYWENETGLELSSGCVRCYVRVTVLPSTTPRGLISNLVAGYVGIKINTNGTLDFWVNGASRGNSSSALTDTSRWYRIEVKNIGSSQELLIDGVSQVTSSIATQSFALKFGATDTAADTYTAYFDDFTMDDAGYPGEGKVGLLIPTSDNARATLWTGGAGGTSSLFEAVNNTPPIGKATETDLTQIEHAGGAAGTTDAYDANMATYASIGIKSTDTINCVMPFIWHGEDSATGTKLLSFNIKSNPATSNTGSFDVAPTSGAAGDFPSGWFTRTGTLGNAPSVTIGTSPVFTVIRPETATRVASVCFMGIYVDYTPNGTRTAQTNQAVKRGSFF